MHHLTRDTVMERETVGVLRDKVVRGKGYSINWSTDTLVPFGKFTEYYIQSPAFKLWGFDARLKIDINQPQRHCQNVSMVIRLSPMDPLLRPKDWAKMCEGPKSFLRAIYNFRMIFDTRDCKGKGIIKILTTSPNVFQLNFVLPLDKESGTPEMWEHFQIRLMIEKPEKKYSLEMEKVSLDNLHGLRHLSNGLGRLLANPEGSDLRIRCGNQEFPVHKFILSARSTTLKKMTGELKEGTLDLDMIKGHSIDPKVVKIVLEWIYTGVLKDKGVPLADISALSKIWGLEKLECYSNKLIDTNYRLELPKVKEIEPPPMKRSKTDKESYNLVLGDLKVIPWKSREMEWKVELPKLGEEVKEFHSPAVRFFGVDWSLLMKVHYNTEDMENDDNVSISLDDFKTVFQISLEKDESALQDLGYHVGPEPKLKFHIKYKDHIHEYHCNHNNDADYSDYSGSEDKCGTCSLHRVQVKRIGVDKYKFLLNSSIVNRLYEKGHEIKIDWMVHLGFKSGLLADKVHRGLDKEKVFLENLSVDLGSLLDVPGKQDVVLRCERKDFRAHKIILGAQSSVFKVMLETPMKESLESVVEVRDVHGELVDGDVVGVMLRWIYTGELGELDEGQSLITLGLADFYDLNKLKELCEVKLKALIREESVVDILIMADFVQAVELKLDAIQFINKNKSITETEEFKERVSWDLLREICMA